MNLSNGNPSLNYGSVSGLVTFAGFSGAYFTGINPFGGISWLWVWVPVLMIVLSIKAVREIEPGGPFSFGRAFKTGIITAFFSATLYCLLLYLLGKVSPGIMDIYLQQLAEGIEMSKSYLPEKMLDEMYDQMEETTIADLAWAEFFSKMLGGFIISLVASAVLFRKNPTYPAE